MTNENTEDSKNLENTKSQIPSKPRPWLLPLLSSLLFSFTIFLYSPLNTFLLAGSELWFSASAFLPTCLLLFAACLVLTFGFSMLLRGTLRKIVCALMIGLSFSIYLQGSFLNIDYGVLDGRLIDWDQFGTYGRWNGLMWALLTLLPVALIPLLKKRSVGVLRFVSTLLLLTQLVSIGALGLTTPNQNNVHVNFTTAKQFDLSKQSNIIVFVIDTLDRSTVLSYLNAHPTLSDKLDGFTLFENSTGLYPVTKFSIPALLTNHLFLSETSYERYLEDSWAQSDLLNTLQRSGYASYVYTTVDFATRSTLPLVDNAVEQPMYPINQRWLLGDMADLICFRYAPHSFKKHFIANIEALQNNRQGTLQPIYVLGDIPFFQGVKDGALVASIDPPAFHFYHLRGAHIPYYLQSDGSPIVNDEKNAHTTIGEVQDAYFSMLMNYFDQLRNLGLYDSATIVITADHGNLLVDTAPVLMIKPPQSHGTLQKNTALISQLDVAPTILSAAGLTWSGSSGLDAYSPAASAQVAVPYFYFIDPFTGLFSEYTVTLDTQGIPIYLFTGRVHTPDGIQNDAPPPYDLGTWHAWTTKPFALKWLSNIIERSVRHLDYSGVFLGKPDPCLRLKLASQPVSDLYLELGVREIVGESQRLDLLANNQVITQLTINKTDKTVNAILPPEAFQDGELNLTLRFPDAITEESLNKLSDIDISTVVFTGFSINTTP